LFQRAFLPAQAQRPLQQQRFGFAYVPYEGFDCILPQLLQRSNALVAVDHYITTAVVFGRYNDDRTLLSAFSQRRHQLPLPVRLV
jgi:hypothetical protein